MAKAKQTEAGPYPGGATLAPTTLSALARLNGMLQPYHAEPQTGMHYGEQAKYVSWTFSPKQFRSLELLHLTDLQFGHVECRVKRVVEYRDWVLSEPNRFVLFGGDLIDAATIMSPGEPWQNICGPQRQVYKFCELMAPMRHRILGYCGGNHERRGVKTFGDVGVLIAYILKVPYSDGQQLIDVTYGDHKPFKIALWHGTGAARTKGAKAQMLTRFMESGDSQLYLVGHLHDLVLLGGWRSLRKPGHNNVHIQKIMGGMSTSFLSYWGTYAEVAGLTVSDVAMIRAVLEPDGKWEATIR
jgi:hypothetical protein